MDISNYIDIIISFFIIMCFTLIILLVLICLFIKYMESKNKIKTYRIEKYIENFERKINNVTDVILSIDSIKSLDINEKMEEVTKHIINLEHRYIVNNYGSNLNNGRMNVYINSIINKLNNILRRKNVNHLIEFKIIDNKYYFNTI